MNKQFIATSFLAITMASTLLQSQPAYAINPRAIRMTTKGFTVLKKLGKRVGPAVLAKCIFVELTQDSTCLNILKPKQ